MKNWFSLNPISYQFLSLSTPNTIILPGQPEKPPIPEIRNPQANPPMVFLPK
ncbi:MAG: hypothetical protein ACKO9I_14105 [Sphaerospermopsis kisseleviana]|uniref:hypothetical protein n=1 Tax=unclassified Sphaerospermopsis TaxID=2646443 RepID=UPI0016814D86|nr:MULTISPECIES: hypothetical protein [unclassified Sphaerospermopsis]MBD2131510.1 hypothetical protein [Sphaerospermopsis sp. FACHB-1094]MBD2146257.1 hypothetical protein [Sphaerospermopsis sp. FACHB-1194]